MHLLTSVPASLPQPSNADRFWAVDTKTQNEAQVLTIQEWVLGLPSPAVAVAIHAGEEFSDLFPYLGHLELIEVHFPVFTDGRGFSTARELRERGYNGILKVRGHVLLDQVEYLSRCGFDAFEFPEPGQAEAALLRLSVVREVYQGDARQPLPLFRRR